MKLSIASVKANAKLREDQKDAFEYVLGQLMANVTIVVSAEDTNVVDVAIQVNDGAGTAMAARMGFLMYLSDDVAGDSIVATAPDGGWAIDTDGLEIPLIANKASYFISEADGDIGISVTETGTDTFYLIVVLPDGSLVASDALTFTA
jgi:hypothetical protein